MPAKDGFWLADKYAIEAIRYAALHTRIAKPIPVKFADYIENYDDLEKALKNTKYYTYLPSIINKLSITL